VADRVADTVDASHPLQLGLRMKTHLLKSKRSTLVFALLRHLQPVNVNTDDQQCMSNLGSSITNNTGELLESSIFCFSVYFYLVEQPRHTSNIVDHML